MPEFRVPDSTANKDLWNPRAQVILHALIESYIETGQPVSSRTLVANTGLNLSAATVRNVMAGLESLGYIEAPHVSAGRVPTVHGYRKFVDTMLEMRPPNEAELQRLRAHLGPDKEGRELCEEAGGLLSEIASMAGIVTVQRRTAERLKRVEFLSLDARRVLAVLILQNGEIENLILKVHREYTNYELQSYANYLNAHFADSDLEEVRERVLRELREMHEQMGRVMIEAVKLAGQALDGLSQRSDCMVSGQTNLMQFEELADVDHLYRLFGALNEKREILNLLNKCAEEAQGVKIFIGQESGYQALRGCSIVSAPYTVDNRTVGVLAVIGPTRMAYERIIPLVDVTSKLLGRALKHSA